MFLEDRKCLYKLIKKRIKIETSKYHYYGFLIGIDPVTLTVLIFDGTIHMIFQHAIKSIEQIPNDQETFECENFKQFLDEFFNIHPAPDENISNPVDLEERRKKVLKLFAQNNVPVEEIEKTLIAAYHVCIDPPYTSSDCKSSNTIVLRKIKDILEKGHS